MQVPGILLAWTVEVGSRRKERERERAGEREERRGGCGVELEMLSPSHHLPASHIPPRVLSLSTSVLIVSRKERRMKVTSVWWDSKSLQKPFIYLVDSGERMSKQGTVSSTLLFFLLLFLSFFLAKLSCWSVYTCSHLRSTLVSLFLIHVSSNSPTFYITVLG